MATIEKLNVKDVIYETNEAVSLVLKEPLFKKWHYKPGQFITLELDIDGQKLRRPYSLNSTDSIDKTLSITIKKIENGRVSNYIYENAPRLKKVKAMKPAGEFTLDVCKDEDRHIVLFGGGSGITPMLSIIKAVLNFESKSKVSLVYCNRNKDSIIFKSRLNELQKQFSERFAIKHVLEKDDEGFAAGTGFINKEMISEFLQKLPDYPAEKTEYYICGPSGMMETVENSLHEFEVPEERIHLENFEASLDSVQPDMSEAVPHDVTIKKDGEEHKITVKPGVSILDAALDEGLELPYSCMSGICSTCMGTCKSGQVEMAPGNILAKEQQKGQKTDKVLCCVGHPRTDDVEISFDG